MFSVFAWTIPGQERFLQRIDRIFPMLFAGGAEPTYTNLFETTIQHDPTKASTSPKEVQRRPRTHTHLKNSLARHAH